MTKIKMTGQCVYCLAKKTGYFYYTYESLDDIGKMLVCGKCAEKKSAEIDRVGQLSASAFDKKDIVEMLNESVKELRTEITAAQKKAFGIKDIMMFNLYNGLTVKQFQKELKSKESKIKILSMSEAEKKNLKSFDLNLIKQIKPQVLIGKEESSSGQTLKFKCPLHQEKTASFIWYKNNNRFYCFGCQEKGSIIDLFMKLNNCDFKVACNELQQYV